MNQEPNTTQTEIIKALGIVASNFEKTNKGLALIVARLDDLETQMKNIMHHPRIKELESQVLKLEAKVFNQYTVKLPK